VRRLFIAFLGFSKGLYLSKEERQYNRETELKALERKGQHISVASSLKHQTYELYFGKN